MDDCLETYGVLPCSTTLGGAAFLVLVYGAIVYKASRAIGITLVSCVPLNSPSRGVFTAGVWSLPVVLLLIAASQPTAPYQIQQQIDAQLGIASGCLVFLATLAWAGCVYYGSSSIAAGEEDSTLYGMDSAALAGAEGLSSPGSSSTSSIWQETGVRSSRGMRALAQLVLLSCLPYVVVLGSIALPISGTAAAITGAVLCSLALLYLLGTQALLPHLHSRNKAEEQQRHTRHLAVRALTWYAQRFGRILDSQGQLNAQVAEMVFDKLDRDQDGALSRPELQAMLVSLELAGNPYDDEQLGSQVGFWLREMEGEGSEAISRAAFLAGVARWISDKRAHARPGSKHQRKAFKKDPLAVLTAMPAGSGAPGLAEPLLDEEAAVGSEAAADSEEEDAATSSGSARPSSIHSPAQTLPGSGTGSGSRASLPTLLLGLGLQPLLVSRIARLSAGLLACCLFVRPFFASVMDLAAAAHMPAFYATFVAAPLAVLLQPVQLAWCKAGKRGRRHVNTAMAQLMHMCGLVNTLGLLVVFCSQAVAGRAAGGLVELVLTLLPVLSAAAVAATQARVKCYWAPAAVGLYAVTLLAALLLRLVLH